MCTRFRCPVQRGPLGRCHDVCVSFRAVALPGPRRVVGIDRYCIAASLACDLISTDPESGAIDVKDVSGEGDLRPIADNPQRDIVVIVQCRPIGLGEDHDRNVDRIELRGDQRADHQDGIVLEHDDRQRCQS